MRHLSGGLANRRNRGTIGAVLEEENADKSIIRLSWQDLNRLKEMAKTSHFLARKYLIYTFEGELPDR